MIKQSLLTIAETTIQALYLGSNINVMPIGARINMPGAVSLAYPIAYQALSKACHLEEKYEFSQFPLVHLVFPLVSGFVTTAALAPFLGLSLVNLGLTYGHSSTFISNVLLVRKIGQMILNDKFSIQGRSYVGRMCDYTIFGSYSFAAFPIAESILSSGFVSLGPLFGFAQVCTIRLLGASRETLKTQLALPFIITAITSAFFTAANLMTSYVVSVVPFTATSLIVALVTTIAARFLTPAPKPVQTNEIVENHHPKHIRLPSCA